MIAGGGARTGHGHKHPVQRCFFIALLLVCNVDVLRKQKRMVYLLLEAGFLQVSFTRLMGFSDPYCCPSSYKMQAVTNSIKGRYAFF